MYSSMQIYIKPSEKKNITLHSFLKLMSLKS